MTILQRTRVQIVFTAMVLAAMALAMEGGARLYFALKDAHLVNVRPSALNDYEMHDAAQWNWRPKPGYSATVSQIIQAKKQSGKIFAEELLKRRAAELNIAPDTVVMRINAEGFKGPDLDKTHSRVRILTIGDSCTFGTMFDDYSYPRTLERELTRSGEMVEVINAGVEGYTPSNVLGRIKELKALHPEITTVYIGWNALYAESFGIEYHLKSVQLLRKAYGKVKEKLFGRTEMALEAYIKPKYVQRDTREMKALSGFTPTFMADLETIVKEMRAAGSEVVLMTLPGLFVMDEEPSPRALEIGHLPTFTDNPYVVARISAEYNERLRHFAQRQNLLLVDLEEWSRESLKPRDQYFFDSVHLYEEGQTRIGQYLAQQLLPVVKGKSKYVASRS